MPTEIVIAAVAAVVALVLGLVIGSLLAKRKGQRALEQLAEEHQGSLREQLASATDKAKEELEAAGETHRKELEGKEAERQELSDDLEAKTQLCEELEEKLALARSEAEASEAERLRFRRFADGQFKQMLEQFTGEWKRTRFPPRVEELLEAKEPSKAALERLEALAAPLREWMDQLGLGSAESHFQLGLFHVLKGQMKEALDCFQDASDKGLGLEAWLALGDCHWRQDRPEKAREVYRRCLRAEGMPDRLFFRTAKIAIGKQRFKEGLAALDTLLQNKSRQPIEVYALASLAAGKLERYDRAVEICETGLKHHAGAKELMADLIIPLSRLGREEEAEDIYLKVNETDPTYAKPAFALGVARMHQDNPQAAVRFLEDAIRLDPELAEAHFCLGVIENRRQQFRKALERFERAIEIRPDYAEAYYNMKDAYEGLRDFDKAVAALDQATRLNPNYR